MIEIAARNWTLSKWNHKKCPTVLSKNYPTALSKKLKKSFGCLPQVKFTSAFGPVWRSNRGPQHEIPWAIIVASHWPYWKGDWSLLSTSLCRIWSQNPIKIRSYGFQSPVWRFTTLVLFGVSDYSKNLFFADANNSRKSPSNGANERFLRSLQGMLFINKKIISYQ